MAYMCSDRAGWSSLDNLGILDQVSVDMYVGWEGGNASP